MEIKAKGMSYEEVTEKVKVITNTKQTFKIDGFNSKFCEIDYFTRYGLQTMGKTVGFPAQFLETLNETNAPLAKEVIEDRMRNYFAHDGVPFYAREFLGQISGVVSQKYSYFDDDEVMDIIGNSPLTQMSYLNNIITPERFHTRVMDLNDSFKIAGDDSDLLFCFFIDNSMVGRSAMRVQLGIYRLACTNGLIVPVKELIMCRQVHRGNKDIAEWDEETFNPQKLLDEFKRIISSKGNVFIFCSYNLLGEYHKYFNSEFDTFQFMVWHKINPVPNFRKSSFLNSCELIIACWNRGHIWNFSRQAEMHNYIESPVCMGKERIKSADGTNLHPTQKPIKVLKKIIEIASNENSIVLDCFGGVNSTGDAALQLNRRYIGIEINPVYHQASVNRLKKYGERVE